MPINVKTNNASVSTLNDLNKTSRALQRTFERISSGQRIARAADDAAGLGVAENLRAAHTSAAVAARNTNDGISVISVAEGATAEVGSILVRMRELAVQGASETLATAERAFVQDEYVSLAAEVDRIAAVTEFNGFKLTDEAAMAMHAVDKEALMCRIIQVYGQQLFIDGLHIVPHADGTTPSIGVQVGINNPVNDQIDLTLGDLRGATLGVDTGTIDMSTATGAFAALTDIDAAIATVSGYRSDYGAVENRLGNALTNLETFSESTISAESRIRDADFGFETAQLSQQQVLQQAGVSVLSQAKGLNQAALSLLQN